jgi:hypothetical protein
MSVLLSMLGSQWQETRMNLWIVGWLCVRHGSAVEGPLHGRVTSVLHARGSSASEAQLAHTVFAHPRFQTCVLLHRLRLAPFSRDEAGAVFVDGLEAYCQVLHRSGDWLLPDLRKSTECRSKRRCLALLCPYKSVVNRSYRLALLGFVEVWSLLADNGKELRFV